MPQRLIQRIGGPDEGDSSAAAAAFGPATPVSARRTPVLLDGERDRRGASSPPRTSSTACCATWSRGSPPTIRSGQSASASACGCRWKSMRRARWAGSPTWRGFPDMGGLVDGIGQRTRSSSVQIGPDGVRVEVQETNDERRGLRPRSTRPRTWRRSARSTPGCSTTGLQRGRWRRRFPAAHGWISGPVMPFEIPFGPRGPDPGRARVRGIGSSAPRSPARRRLGVSVGDLHPAVREYPRRRHVGGRRPARAPLAADGWAWSHGDVVLEDRRQRAHPHSVPDVGHALGGIDPGKSRWRSSINRRGHMKTLDGRRRGPTRTTAPEAPEGSGQPRASVSNRASDPGRRLPGRPRLVPTCGLGAV